MSDVTDDTHWRKPRLKAPSLKATQIHDTRPDVTRTAEPVLESTREAVADAPADASYGYDKGTVLTDCKVFPDLSVALGE